ncbi:MAG: ribosome maturation factor RimP [Candidatus Krumholzibacteria bacterium]|nr:ribosome maturation factor RimP [Candidatus Krumholzibacteria bacterium]
MAEGNRADLKRMVARIIDLVESDLATSGIDLLDIRIFRGGGRLQLRIYVDLFEGKISLAQVASASRTVGMLLEEADPFPGQYVIEVSSPGIRRPLRKLEHYQAAVGQKVDLKVTGPGVRRVRGVLREVEENRLVVEVAREEGETTEQVTVELKRIAEGNLDPDFDVQALINADRRRRKDEKREKRQAKKKVRKMRPKGPRS